jgi:hypothetical protein
MLGGHVISIVTTPTAGWLETQLADCRREFLVASPYVGDLLVKFTRRLPQTVKRSLITRTDLRDFAKGSSDIDAVCEVARTGADVFSLPRLHAKVYVVDQRAALVTSANATWSGMQRNWECGVAVSDPDSVNLISKLVLSGFGAAEQPQRWTFSELEKLKEPVSVFRASLPPAAPTYTTGEVEHAEMALPPEQWVRLSSNLPGWMLLTVEGVMGQSSHEFSIQDIYRTCLPVIATRYPANKFPRQKLRQQLQRIRDLGMIEFLGGGRYRRTVSVER